MAHTVAQVGIARRGHILRQVLVLDFHDPQEAVPLEVGPELGLRAAGIVAGGLPLAEGVSEPGVVGQIDPGAAVVLVDARAAVPAVVGIGGGDAAAVVLQGEAVAALVIGVGHHLGRALGDGLALAGDPGEAVVGEDAAADGVGVAAGALFAGDQPAQAVVGVGLDVGAGPVLLSLGQLVDVVIGVVNGDPLLVGPLGHVADGIIGHGDVAGLLIGDDGLQAAAVVGVDGVLLPGRRAIRVGGQGDKRINKWAGLPIVRRAELLLGGVGRQLGLLVVFRY